MAAKRGLFIVVEGLDRSGKTTQCQRLCEHIKSLGKEVKYVKFPNRTTVTGQLINAYLQGTSEQKDEAIHLIFSANRWEAVQGLIADINAGCTIVVDRYSFSGAVFTAAKQDTNPNLTLEWCWNMEVGLPMPDLVFFLDIAPEDAALRGGFGEERYEKEEMQAKVRVLFKELFARLGMSDSVKIINAGRSLQEVTGQILDAFGEFESSMDVMEKAGDMSVLQALGPSM